MRENTGGAYYGPKLETTDYGSDTWEYSREEVQRVSRVAAALARRHQPPLKVTSCDKANVLASGRLWRRVVTEVAPAGPFWEAEPEHQDYLERYPGGYTCHFIRPGWKLPRRARVAETA